MTFDALLVVAHLPGSEFTDRKRLRSLPDIKPDNNPSAAITDRGYISAADLGRSSSQPRSPGHHRVFTHEL
jgi:hypothetical protein